MALLARRYVLASSALAVVGLGPERVLYPDVQVVAPKRVREASPSRPAEAVELASPMAEEVPLLGVEIRDVAGRRLVTLIEILSPVNKHGEGVGEYAARRAELLRTRTHLLEIDLLRGGTRIQLLGEPPPAPYYVYLSRRERRPMTQVWPVPLRGPLPVVPVPLLPPDADVSLDLGAAVCACFELVGYERLLDYAAPLPPPPLSDEDAAWVAERLRAAGLAT